MAVLHVVPLPPGARPVAGPGFALILETAEDEPPLSAAELEQFRTFALEAGAASSMATDRSLVILGAPTVTVEPGPCPSYMEGLGVNYVCDLRDTHTGLHEQTTPGAPGMPPVRATWGDRERFNESADAFTAVMTRDKQRHLIDPEQLKGEPKSVKRGHDHMLAEPCTDACYGDRAAVKLPMIEPILGVCKVGICERPTVDSDFCEVHKDPPL